MESVLHQPARPRIALRRILLPVEHGAWSLLIEPLIVGCAVAASAASPWIVLMVTGAFFARQPIKVFSLSLNNPNAASRSLLFSILFITIAAVGLFGTVLFSSTQVLLPLIVAGPLAVQQLYADVSGRSRSSSAEIFGAVAVGSSVAMLTFAGGYPWSVAISLWLVFACRFVPSILYVRNRLLLEKGKPHDRIWPAFAHLAGLVVVGCMAFIGVASWLTLIVFTLLLARSTAGLSSHRTKMKAMRIGVWEVLYGILIVLSMIVGHYLGI